MVRERYPHPIQLPGATEFTADRDTADAVSLIRLLKAYPQFTADLRARATDLAINYARRREPGDWVLVYLAFVDSGDPDIEPWWSHTTADLWREAGFKGRPPYERTWTRFTELEACADEFQDAAGLLIQHARVQSGGLVGRYVHVDATAAETHARLIHDCKRGDGCPGFKKRKGAGSGEPRHEPSDHVEEDRRVLHDEPVDDDAAPLIVGDADAVEADDQTIKRVKIGKHWYRLGDPDAGVRAYTGRNGSKKFWVGYYHAKAIDDYTGGVLAVNVFSASTQEYHEYDQLLDRVNATCGADPLAVCADKGYAVRSVFEQNTRRGVATVIPWRPSLSEPKRIDRQAFDRHGIPRCKHCGGPTRFVRFNHKPKPRLWFRCELETEAECRRVAPQSMLCDRGFKHLLPLWRTSETYHALRRSGLQHEGKHQYWRSRYGVAGDSTDTRPKRRGRAWQQLRSNAALVLEWLRILMRQGWLGSARRNKREPRRPDGATGRAAILAIRREHGLDRPYRIDPAAKTPAPAPAESADEAGSGVPPPPGDPPPMTPADYGLIADPPDGEDIPF